MIKKSVVFDILFWFGYGLALFPVFFSNIPIFQSFLRQVDIAGFVILFCCMLVKNLDKYPIRKNLAHYCMMLVLFVVFFISANYAAVRLFVIAYSLCMGSFREFAKKDMFMRLAFFCILLVLLVFGMCETTFRMRGELMRFTLGFNHPNMAGFFIMTLVFEYIYVYRRHSIWLQILVIVVATLAIIVLTDSRACVVGLVGFSIVYFLGKKGLFKKKTIPIRGFLYFLPLTLTAASAFLILLYSKGLPVAVEANTLLSNRIQYALEAVKEIGFSVFGKTIPQGSVVLDDAYVFYLLSFGMVPYLIYIVLVSFGTMIRVEVKKDMLYFLILSIMLIYGLAEKMVFMPNYNVFILGIAPVLFLLVGHDNVIKRGAKCLRCR